VEWEKSEGKVYAVLFNKIVEIYSAEKDGEGAVSRHVFDIHVTSMAFIGKSDLVVSDI
jgi:hypothetical protein